MCIAYKAAGFIDRHEENVLPHFSHDFCTIILPLCVKQVCSAGFKSCHLRVTVSIKEERPFLLKYIFSPSLIVYNFLKADFKEVLCY